MTRHETSVTPQLDMADINAVYEQMNLATATQRAHFMPGLEARPTLNLEVVISSTSQPFKK